MTIPPGYVLVPLEASEIVRELQGIRVGMLDQYQAATILERLTSKAQVLSMISKGEGIGGEGAARSQPISDGLRPTTESGEPSGLVRSPLARIALAAWANVDLAQLPSQLMWIEHPNDVNWQAWERVVAAISEVCPAAKERDHWKANHDSLLSKYRKRAEMIAKLRADLSAARERSDTGHTNGNSGRTK